MTQERFLKMLGDPDLLATISYQELKTLALAYPYAHNLHYLLALKARQDHHPEFERTLAAAAAHSLHRPQLFHLIAPQRVGIVEEVLELRAIDAVQRELEARAPLAREAEPDTAPTARLSVPLPDAGSMDEPAHENRPPAEDEHPINDSRVDEATDDKNDQPGMLRFDQWLDQFNLPSMPVRPRREKQEQSPRAFSPVEPAQTGETVKAAQSLAERSVTPKEEVVSETMARLFAAQGHRERAIVMYERLCLAFPEKSDYFAAEIDKLKK